MPFRVETFDRIEDAARALAANRNARFYGGGTILMCAVNAGSQSFDTLIRINRNDLSIIRAEGDRMSIGSGVTMSQVLQSRDLDFLHPVAIAVGGPAIRTAATVGGNLYASAPYGDFATALLALGAEVQFGGDGGSAMPIDQFLADRDRHRERIVSNILVRRPGDAGSFRFRKVTRVKPKGAAVMTLAALLPRSRSGIRVAYGNMAPTPVRAAAVERALEGANLDEAGIGPALAAATRGLSPASDALASQWYRQEVAPVHLKRMLLGQAG